MTDPNAHINYSFADIERYLNGGMTAKEMHDLERTALQDPFLADAIDGYREADKNIVSQHLNEIAATLQKNEPAKVIVMPKKRNYGWLVAASLLAVIGAGIFLIVSHDQSPAPLAVNELKNSSQNNRAAQNNQPITPEADSVPATISDNPALSKTENREDIARTAPSSKKKPLPYKATPAETSSQLAEAPQVAMASPAPVENEKAAEQKQSAPALRDTAAQVTGAVSGVAVTRAAKQQSRQQGYYANTWTNEKGKPFLLSDVEVINISKKGRKKSDTSAIQPEGGWMAFQDYLFSRLSRNDSLILVNSNHSLPDGLELEFSVDEEGSAYDVKVLHAQDSTLSEKIVNAIQSGPKWKGDDHSGKRLRLRY